MGGVASFRGLPRGARLGARGGCRGGRPGHPGGQGPPVLAGLAAACRAGRARHRGRAGRRHCGPPCRLGVPAVRRRARLRRRRVRQRPAAAGAAARGGAHCPDPGALLRAALVLVRADDRHRQPRGPRGAPRGPAPDGQAGRRADARPVGPPRDAGVVHDAAGLRDRAWHGDPAADGGRQPVGRDPAGDERRPAARAQRARRRAARGGHRGRGERVPFRAGPRLRPLPDAGLRRRHQRHAGAARSIT